MTVAGLTSIDIVDTLIRWMGIALRGLCIAIVCVAAIGALGMLLAVWQMNKGSAVYMRDLDAQRALIQLATDYPPVAKLWNLRRPYDHVRPEAQITEFGLTINYPLPSRWPFRCTGCTD